jgi:uncharacterized coiled-coil DUF342 family protein
MAKHGDAQQDSANQTTDLSRQEERALARALSELAAALRDRPGSDRPHSAEATQAAEEYRDIKNALRTFLEPAPPGYYSNRRGD